MRKSARKLDISKPLLALAVVGVFVSAQDPAPNRILRPADGASLSNGKIEGIAKVAKSGAVFIDGAPVATKEKAPGVLTFLIDAPNGAHTLELKYDGGSPGIVLVRINFAFRRRTDFSGRGLLFLERTPRKAASTGVH